MLILIYILVILLGLLFGSFLNCMAWRLYKDKTVLGRSMCPHCSHQLAWYDNIPVVSWLILQAKCRYCQKKISVQYILVEIITAGLFALAFYYNPLAGSLVFSWNDILFLIKDWILICFLVIIFIMDFNWYIIVDKISLPGAVIILVLNLLLGMEWQSLLLAGIIGAGFFLLQFIVSKGKWIGGGDIRLGLLMGFALGYPQILIALGLAYFLGAIIGIILIMTGKKKRSSEIPFGVFLTTGTIISLFWGQYLLSWYLNLYY